MAAFNLLSMHTSTLGPHLLPNLRSIYWGATSWDWAPFLRLLLNPELTDVHITFPDEGQHVYQPAAVSLIPTGNLTHLELEFMGDDDLSLGALHNLLDEASETLRSVALDGRLSRAVFSKLLQLPNLRYLDMQLPRLRISPPVIVSPSLEKLVVSFKETKSWLHSLGNITNLTLQELDVTFTGSSPIYLQKLGPSLIKANAERTLTSLACTSGNIISLTGAGIRPLLSFGRLTRLEIIGSCTEEQCGFNLDDSIISDLAVALSQLKSLTLGGIPYNTCNLDVTVTSLVALSTNCVNLDYLQLHFNANDIITRDTHTSSQTRKFTCKLRSRRRKAESPVRGSEDTLLVTFTILHIFPHVENVYHAGMCWSQVMRNILLFRKVPRIIPTEN